MGDPILALTPCCVQWLVLLECFRFSHCCPTKSERRFPSLKKLHMVLIRVLQLLVHILQPTLSEQNTTRLVYWPSELHSSWLSAVHTHELDDGQASMKHSTA